MPPYMQLALSTQSQIFLVFPVSFQCFISISGSAEINCFPYKHLSLFHVFLCHWWLQCSLSFRSENLTTWTLPLLFSLNYLSVSLFCFPTKSVHHISLLLPCKSTSPVTSSLSAKGILLLLQYSFSPKLQPLILGFFKNVEENCPHLTVIFHISLLLLCWKLTFSFLCNQTTFFPVKFFQKALSSSVLPFLSFILGAPWPIPQAASLTPTVFLLHLCGEF